MKAIALAICVAALGLVIAASLYIEGASRGPLAQGADEKPGSQAPPEDDGEEKDPRPSGRTVDDGSPEVELPKVLPDHAQGVVVSNSGACVAVSRFYRLLQDKELKADTVIATPFQLDGRKVLTDDKEVQAFIDKAREGSLRKGRTNTLMQMTFLPAGNTWEEAQRWLAPTATGERAKALFDHAEKHEAWLVLVLLARTKGDSHIHEHTLIAVTGTDSEGGARVIGFMD